MAGMGVVSPDGAWWWDGAGWRLTPPALAAAVRQAEAGVDARTRRRVRRSVRRGRPTTDSDLRSLAQLYLEREIRKADADVGNWNAFRWLWALCALMWVVTGVLGLMMRHHRGVPLFAYLAGVNCLLAVVNVLMAPIGVRRRRRGLAASTRLLADAAANAVGGPWGDAR